MHQRPWHGRVSRYLRDCSGTHSQRVQPGVCHLQEINGIFLGLAAVHPGIGDAGMGINGNKQYFQPAPLTRAVRSPWTRCPGRSMRTSFLGSRWIGSPACSCSYRTTGSTGSRSANLAYPARCSTRQAVAAEMPRFKKTIQRNNRSARFCIAMPNWLLFENKCGSNVV